MVLALPVYATGLLLLLLFAVRWPLFPLAGGGARRLVLPVLTLALGLAAGQARLVRAAARDELGRDYVRTALAKGLDPREVLQGHVLPNAAAPALALFGVQLGSLLGGAVLTETVFALNGLGRYAVLAVAHRDYPALQGVILCFTVGSLAASLLVDLACAALDPRPRE